MRDDLAVFILTHGRANSQKTLQTLKKCGYTGKTYLIIDDEDEQQDEYCSLYKDAVIKFSKKEIEYTFDTMTSIKEYRSVVYARNAAYSIAKVMGIKWVFVCDDDISGFSYRVIKSGKLGSFDIKNFDDLLLLMCEIADKGNICIFSFSQAGLYIGGANETYLKGSHRNISQAMLLNTDNPIKFRGLFSEDLHASLDAGIQGKTAIATTMVQIHSPTRGTNKGGLFDLYKDGGTYVRTFFTILAYPNVAKITIKNGEFKPTFNHSAFVPLILSERWKK